jgi:hypothetical protein
MVGKTTVASPRPWLYLRSGRDSLRCDPRAHHTSRALPDSPWSAASCKPTPLRSQDRSHPVCPAPSVRRRPVWPPPLPPSAATAPWIWRPHPTLPPPPRAPPPIRHRNRSHRRPPTASLWPTPEPPSLSTVHRCPESRAHQLLRSCNEGGKIYLVTCVFHLRAIRSAPVHTQPMHPLCGSSPNLCPPAGAATDVAYLPKTLTSPPLMASLMPPSSAGSAPIRSRPLPFFSLCARKWAMRS